ncbi:MAG TPA: PorP/SprF family type IX secretion system membrane protein [Bacteroidales bacterium]|nr:PorP/SprF family type IX secretion system membrane protein [Bacteroidales bacterium]HRS18186.1 PorP/SprF family type IX secretion system membrane protein [Bacteroidales bacterium]
MKRIIISILYACFVFQAFGQDIHFSNFYTNVLNLNPAFTGYFKGKYRYNLTYRDRYRTVAVPYQTVSLGIDTKTSKLHGLRKTFGYGILLNYDIAGDSQFNTIQLQFPVSYIHITSNKQWNLSAGLMPALVFNSLDYTLLRFPDQFDGVQYNPNLPMNEDFDKTNSFFFNIGAGGQATYKPNKTQSYTMGLAGYNLTTPNISFFDDKSVQLYARMLIHAMAIVEVKPDVDMVPAVKMQFQGKQKEYHVGAMAIKYFDNLSIIDVSGGVWFRSRDRDAIIVGVGCNYLGYTILCNYDINISSLKKASNGHGAFELTVSSILYEQKKRKKMTSVKCPPYL